MLSVQHADLMTVVLPLPVSTVLESKIVRMVTQPLLLLPRHSVQEGAPAVAVEVVLLSVCLPWVVLRSSCLAVLLLYTIQSCSDA